MYLLSWTASIGSFLSAFFSKLVASALGCRLGFFLHVSAFLALSGLVTPLPSFLPANSLSFVIRSVHSFDLRGAPFVIHILAPLLTYLQHKLSVMIVFGSSLFYFQRRLWFQLPQVFLFPWILLQPCPPLVLARPIPRLQVILLLLVLPLLQLLLLLRSFLLFGLADGLLLGKKN